MFSLLISSARCITSMGACQFNGQGGLFSFVTCSIKKKTKMRETERGQKKAARGLGWAAYIRSRTSCLGDQLRNGVFWLLEKRVSVGKLWEVWERCSALYLIWACVGEVKVRAICAVPHELMSQASRLKKLLLLPAHCQNSHRATLLSHSYISGGAGRVAIARFDPFMNVLKDIALRDTLTELCHCTLLTITSTPSLTIALIVVI